MSKESKVESRKSKVSQLQDKIAELEADLKRVQADFVNYKRRSDEERGEVLNLVKQDVVLQILPLLDNIGRALGHLPPELEQDGWARGVSQVAKQSEEILKSLGVTKIEALGQPFDPNLHDAIAYEESNATGQESNVEVVTEELQPGYRLGDKVIRHAMVKVGRAATPAEPQPKGNDVTSN
ncbi:MAG TPA: nucleotide exchange factor GrpE [Candidatus Saccharimonadales bacterium]|nr:nucleotide exchange factor GrpE [Candidatus Saccharimonadales bacterium]